MTDTPSLPQLAVQLWSLREDFPADPGGTLARVATTGVLGVEYASLADHAPADVRRWVEDVGLRGIAVHRAPTPDRIEQVLDEAQVLGVDRVVWQWVATERVADDATIGALADELAAFADRAAARDITVGFHNHWDEMRRLPDGRTALEHMFERTDPRVFAEVDVYWAQMGGASPSALVQALGDRVRLLHIKDGPADDPESSHVAAGHGVVDIRGAIEAATRVDWHVIEFDRCATDICEAIAASAAWLVAEGLSEGRS